MSISRASSSTSEVNSALHSSKSPVSASNELPSNEEPAVDLLTKPEITRVLDSDVAINALLSRLKQSLLTCEELTKFVRKKYLLEEVHAQELGKTFKNFFPGNTGSSSLQRSIHGVLEFDGKLAQVKQSYVKALHKMSDELGALLLTMTKLRKGLKENSRRLEKEVADAIHMAEKAKNRYHSLCQDWEKVRMADPTKTKLTLRGSKTTREQEEDLQRKIDSADLEFKQRVDHSSSLRSTFLSRERPKIVSELKDLIMELDTAMAIQLQKYTIWTETLILNSGVTITPFDSSQSMKSIAASMSNELDLYNYLNKYNQGSRSNNFVNKNLIPVEYKQHPSMLKPASGKSGPNKSSTFGSVQSSTFSVNTAKNSLPNRIVSTQHESPFDSTAKPKSTSNFSGGALPNTNTNGSSIKPSSVGSPSLQQKPVSSMLNVAEPSSINQRPQDQHEIDGRRKDFPTLDPGNGVRSSSLTTSMITSASERPFSEIQSAAALPPGINKNFKTFGVPLESLLEYEQDMVPAIVRQCIYVVDKHGLDLEGIYRKSANVLDVSRLREEIDKDPSNISMITPPKNYTESDIYLAGSLLKAFFANLPESLLPASMTPEIKTCLTITDPVTRKNFMHGLIYKLPDGQYWTLRALIFHLIRIIEHEPTNRMTLKSVCIIWGPTLISPSDTDVNDVNYQIQAMEVLIDVANQAFEPE